VLCLDCETEFAHYYDHDGTNNLFRAPDNEHAVAVYDPADDRRGEVMTDGGEETVIIGSSRHTPRYHRSESCIYVLRSNGFERVPLSELDDQEPCSYCATEDAADRESIEVCPECDTTDIQTVYGQANAGHDKTHRCRQCSATFDEPHTRPRKAAKPSKVKGLAGKLMQANADDVGGEHVDGEPMPDGGQTWRDFDIHVMQGGTTANDYFHSTDQCPRIKDAERAVDRDEHYVAYHEPLPCVDCHPEVGNAERGQLFADGGESA
jgi:hypothetical protein